MTTTNQDKKYELRTNDTITIHGKTHYRIRALKDFKNEKGSYYVKKGELGGYVASENNLSHEGTAWVADDALVTDDALIEGHALVKDNAQVKDNALVTDGAKVTGYALIKDNAKVKGSATIKDNALLKGDCLVTGNALVGDDAQVKDNACVIGHSVVAHSSIVESDAVIKDGNIFDNALISGNAIIDCDATIAGAMKIDFEEKAPQFAVSDTHWAKTWLLDEQAPKVAKPAVIADLHDKIREKMGFAHLED